MMPSVRRLALGLVLTLFAASTVLAAGNDNGFSSKPKDPNLVQARSLIEKQQFGEAIPFLEKSLAANPKSADTYNLLGYSHRKIGKTDAAFGFYAKALALEPEHRGANEYLGELYLETGQLAKARERLEVLDDACFFPCEEYTELKQAIKAYEAKQ